MKVGSPESPRFTHVPLQNHYSAPLRPGHEGFVEISKRGDIDLLLHSDSITDWWVQGDANKAIFDKYFGGIKTANFAIAGDATQGVLWGLKNGEGQGFQPKAIMLIIAANNIGGTNNAGAMTAAEIAEGIGAVVLETRNDFPDALINPSRGLPARSSRRFGPRQDRRYQPDHRETGGSTLATFPLKIRCASPLFSIGRCAGDC
jgi:hypothetical protein